MPLGAIILRPTLHALAQSGVGGVFFWSFILIILIIAGAAAVMRLRRWLKEDEPPSSAGIGFTLSDLRQLHKQGKMTDEEFERARAKMVEAGRAMAAKMPHPLTRPAAGETHPRSPRRPPDEGDL
jgi:hypothetical protein